ncbi:Monocarboxylate transporter 14 [Nymphon striatum]|nr:Monocarboxylate transporter 14 [Nymphon striatum]
MKYRLNFSTKYPNCDTNNHKSDCKSKNGNVNINWKKNKASSKVKKFLLEEHIGSSPDIVPKTEEKIRVVNDVISTSTETKRMSSVDKPCEDGKLRQLNNGRKSSNFSFQSHYQAEMNMSDVKIDILGKQSKKLGIKESNDIDGGWGWVVVLAAFLCIFMTEGVVNSFGIIMLEIHETFDGSYATTAWIESLLISLYFCSGIANGILINKFGCRAMAMSGSIISALGFCASSQATSIGTLMLLYGIIGGTGFGMMYCSSIVIIGHYFDKKQGLAMGITTSGSGIGTFIIPPLVQKLIEVYGLSGTVLIIGGMLLNGLVFGALMKPVNSGERIDLTSQINSPKDKTETSVKVLENNKDVSSFRKASNCFANDNSGIDQLKAPDIGGSQRISKTITKPILIFIRLTGLDLLKNPLILLIVTSSSLAMLGFFVPYVYIPKNAENKGIDPSLSVYLISVIGIANTFGRLMCGIMADKISNSSLILYTLSLILSGISLLIYPLANSMAGMAALCALFGFFISAYITLTPAILIDILGISKLPTAFGIVCLFRGIFSIIGPPAAGAVFDGVGSFDIPFCTTGVLMIISGFFSLSVKCWKRS